MTDSLAIEMTDGTPCEAERSEEAHPNVAVVDHADLVARCMGNLALAERILAKFEQHLAEDIVLLENQVNLQDAAGVASVAHRLKGASASVSANGLCKVFGRLEQLGRSEELQQAAICMKEVQSEWLRFKSHSPSFLPAERR